MRKSFEYVYPDGEGGFSLYTKNAIEAFRRGVQNNNMKHIDGITEIPEENKPIAG